MAVHLYGVVPAATPLPDMVGRRDSPLRLVGDEDVAVIVSDVDEHAPAGAKDLLAHARTLEACVEYATVIPMKFGIMLQDDDAVRREVLERDHESMQELLQSFDGLIQVSIRVFLEEEPALREILNRRPDLRAMRERTREPVPSGPTSGQLQLGQAVAEALEQLAAEYAASLAKLFETVTVSASIPEPRASLEVLNAAYLLKRADQQQLDALVAAVRRQYFGVLVLRYVGPQPPYSFLEAARWA